MYRIYGKLSGKEEQFVKNIKQENALRAQKIINVLLMAVPFVLCWYFYYNKQIIMPFYQKGSWLISALFLSLYVTFARIYNGFAVAISKPSELAYSQGLGVLIADGIMYVMIWILSRSLPNMLPGLGAFACQIAVSWIWSNAVYKWYHTVYPPKKSAIIFDYQKEMDMLIQQYGMEKEFDIQFSVDADSCVADLSILDDLETVFISGVHSHDRNIIIKYCIARGIQAYVLPRIGDVLMSGARRVHMFHLPMLRVNRYSPHPEVVAMKRIFDIAFSGLTLLLLSPVMLATAIAIKATDGGPVLYKQTRLTKDSKEFQVLKFRSMRVDAERDGVARLSTGDADDRITPVGRLIRKVRIDELPQLVNILRGDMSVVGPRPERPEIAAQYEQTLPEFRLRLQVKAGLTGYAQVYGKYNTTPYDKLQMDLMYIANPSFIEDLRIIFATIKILFTPESTEGFQTENVVIEKEFSGVGK